MGKLRACMWLSELINLYRSLLHISSSFFFLCTRHCVSSLKKQIRYKIYLTPTFFQSCRVPWPQYLTCVVVVAMDEQHCSLEHRFMRVRNVEILFFFDIYLNPRQIYPCQERGGTFFNIYLFVFQYNMLFVTLGPSCDHFPCLETLPRDLKRNFVAGGQATYFSDLGGASRLVTCRLSSVPPAHTLTSVLFGSRRCRFLFHFRIY